jgi:hypothetical protein
MSIAALWLPILVAAVVAFIAGAVIWMAMPWHKTDWSNTSDEEAVRAALKGSAPGTYNVPHATSNADLAKPEMVGKFEEGPNAFITVVPSGVPAMGSKLGMMFVYNIAVAVVCAYVLSRTVAPDADYLMKFRIAGNTAFIAYGFAYIQESIWFGRPWSLTIKTFIDALIYGLLTGGVFGWLA